MTTVAYDYLLLRPDWSNGVAFRRKWKTGILTSITGKEKRASLFTRVRRSIEYDLVFLDAAEMNYFKRKMFRSLHRIWGIPIWPDMVLLTAGVGIGANTLPVDSTNYRGYSIGTDIILIDVDDPETFEVHKVLTVTDTQIVIVGLTANAWTVRSAEIYPLLRCRIRSGQQMTALTDGVGRARIEGTETLASTTSTTSSTVTSTSSSTSTSNSTSSSTSTSSSSSSSTTA